MLGHSSELLIRFRVKPVRSRRKKEEIGISKYPRPDLLAAAGLPQAFQPDPTPSEEN